MDNSILQNPANPFTVWAYIISYTVLLGYLGYLIWRYCKES